MSKQKLAAARELIREKNYEEARAVLKTIDHPTAKKWLTKLDKIAPQSLPEKQRQGGCIPQILALAVIFFVITIAILIGDSQLPASSPRPTPTNVIISRCSGSQFLNCYQNQLRAVIEQSGGRVTGSGNERYPGGQLDSWVDVELTGSKNYTTARNVMEKALRTYAGAMPPESAGSFMVTVSWTRDGRKCFDNAGMGFQTMRRINWENVSQQGIFDSIDRNIYGDGDGHFSQIGIAPDPSAFPECNR